MHIIFVFQTVISESSFQLPIDLSNYYCCIAKFMISIETRSMLNAKMPAGA